MLKSSFEQIICECILSGWFRAFPLNDLSTTVEYFRADRTKRSFILCDWQMRNTAQECDPLRTMGISESCNRSEKYRPKVRCLYMSHLQHYLYWIHIAFLLLSGVLLGYWVNGSIPSVHSQMTRFGVFWYIFWVIEALGPTRSYASLLLLP